jgi:hypothetical protein
MGSARVRPSAHTLQRGGRLLLGGVADEAKALARVGVAVRDDAHLHDLPKPVVRGVR